jgi:preprotein translocase subunit Sec63
MLDFILVLILLYAISVITSRVRAKNAFNARRVEPEKAARKDELYYAGVLQLSGRLSRDEIKKKYRELVSQYHPDKVTHLGPKLRVAAEEEMKEINEAYNFFKKQYEIN